MSTLRDPVRLVLDPGCPESERDLLRHGAGIVPPRDAEARVWRGLVGVIGAAAVGGAADASTKTTTTVAKVEAAGLTTTKVVAVVAALAALAALVAFGAYLVVSTKGARPPVSIAPVPAVPAPTIAPPPRPAAGEAPPWADAPPPADTERSRPAPGPRRSVRARLRSEAAAGPSAAAPSPVSRLREETTFIKEARQALREGDAARALRVLEECRRVFPAGVLEQERERLAIEALVKDGRASDASARAAQFLRKYPDSPHAGEVRGLGQSESRSR
jgi:outer membrane lipoprotein YfiO